MRTDDSTARETFRKSQAWARNPTTGETKAETDQRMIDGDEIARGRVEVHSLSGKERNHFFLNCDAGEDFANLSALSGLDSVADGRGFALLDYDRDGWLDVAVVNANSPLTQLYHNDIGSVSGVRGGVIAVRFVGGNATASASEWSNRDGYGAKVKVVLEDGVELVREHRCGEGFATQNSSTMLVGIGGRDGVESVTVTWPSGKMFSLEGVAEGTLLTAYENRAAGAFTEAGYRNLRERAAEEFVDVKRFPVAKPGGAEVQVYTTTATWCVACIGHLPAVADLAQDGVELFGVPIDVEDDAVKLAAYVEERQPAYEMLGEIGTGEKEAVVAFLQNELRMREVGLPSSVIRDGEGKVLEVMQGVPTVSQVRRWVVEEEG